MNRRVAAMALVAALGFSTLLLAPPAAAGGIGAGAKADGDRIISSIIAAGSGRRSSGGGAKPPDCLWHTLTDTQVIFLIHVLASRPSLLASEFQDVIRQFANRDVVRAWPTTTATTTTTTEPRPTTSTPTATVPASTTTSSTTTTLAPRTHFTVWSLKVRICGGAADAMKSTSHTEAVNWSDGDETALISRATRIDHLGAPRIHTTPPLQDGRAVIDALIGEPLFAWVRDVGEVTATLHFGGRTVTVRAQPRRVTLYGGEPGDTETVECSGLGASYHDLARADQENSDRAASPMALAGRPDACAIVFGKLNDASRGDRPDWLGYARVDWSGQYTVTESSSGIQIGGGPLVDLFTTSPLSVAVHGIEAAIERPR